MARYFFDSIDNSVYSQDDDGIELPDIFSAKLLAVQGLTELAVEVLPGTTRHELAIEVRDGRDQVILRAVMLFHLEAVAIH